MSKGDSDQRKADPSDPPVRPPAPAASPTIRSDVPANTARKRRQLAPEKAQAATESRYGFKGLLGVGGSSEVVAVRDERLQRIVALKRPRTGEETPTNLRRLAVEARVAGSLEHPNILPIYDLDWGKEGTPSYTMRIARHQTLHDSLHGDNPPGVHAICALLRQVALTVHYAHEQGVIHRDLKAANILVGEHGEVYVIDWGACQLMRHHPEFLSLDPERQGTLVGTPGFMSPEQARGDIEAIGPYSDVYGLGAVLYEALTGHAPFGAKTMVRTLLAVMETPPIPPAARAPDREIPPELDAICMNALEKEPTKRYPSARSFADALSYFLDGAVERQRRQRALTKALKQTHQYTLRYEALRRRRDTLITEAERLRHITDPAASAEEKAPLWRTEEQLAQFEAQLDEAFDRVILSCSEALAHVPEAEEPRRILADLYWQRFEAAERAGDRAASAYFAARVRQFDDGMHALLLDTQAFLRLHVSPSAATLQIETHQPQRYGTARETIQGESPLPDTPVALPHGTYLLTLRHPAHQTVQVHTMLTRGRSELIHVALPPANAIPESFVVVPAAGHDWEPGKERPRDFAIAERPVTCGEYLSFINAVAAQDPKGAKDMGPRVGPKHYFVALEGGGFSLPETDVEGDAWDPEWPIMMISYEDALAYAKWRGTEDGFSYRLPTAAEWLRASQGADGRPYPWGLSFDPALCHMRESAQGKNVPAPVGGYTSDRSPYGLQDVAGNIAEWTATRLEGGRQLQVIQGAAYSSPAVLCHLEHTMASESDARIPQVGFRLALDVPPMTPSAD